MKTKIIFCLCLITGIATARLSSQITVPVKPKSVLTSKVLQDLQEVNCNGEQVDYLRCKETVYYVLRFKDGNLFWEKMPVFGEITSDNSNEVFRKPGNDKADFIQGIQIRLSNIGRSKDNHYSGLIKWDWLNDALQTFIKPVYVKDKKKQSHKTAIACPR